MKIESIPCSRKKKKLNYINKDLMALVEGPPLWVEEKIHKMDKIERERERERGKKIAWDVLQGERNQDLNFLYKDFVNHTN